MTISPLTLKPLLGVTLLFLLFPAVVAQNPCARSDVVCWTRKAREYTNDFRAAPDGAGEVPVPALGDGPVAQLDNAVWYSHELVKRGSLVHQSLQNATDSVGCGRFIGGENIAQHTAPADDLNHDAARMCVTQWINSAGHRANMLRDRFTEVSIAIAFDPDSENIFCVQTFSQPWSGTSSSGPGCEALGSDTTDPPTTTTAVADDSTTTTTTTTTTTPITMPMETTTTTTTTTTPMTMPMETTTTTTTTPVTTTTPASSSGTTCGATVPAARSFICMAPVTSTFNFAAQNAEMTASLTLRAGKVQVAFAVTQGAVPFRLMVGAGVGSAGELKPVPILGTTGTFQADMFEMDVPAGRTSCCSQRLYVDISTGFYEIIERRLTLPLWCGYCVSGTLVPMTSTQSCPYCTL